MPQRAKMSSWRCSGVWSPNLLTMTCVISPGPAMPPGIGRGSTGAAETPFLQQRQAYLGSHVDVSLKLGRLIFQFSGDVLANPVHLATTARALLFFRLQVVIMANLPELVPVNLPLLAAAMAFDFGFGFLLRRGLFCVGGHRDVQLEQMALPLAFGETLTPPAKRPTLEPRQLFKCGGVFLLQLLVGNGRFV